MSDGDRNRYNPALIGAIAVAIVTIALYWAMLYQSGYQSGYNERKAQIQAEHYASQTADQIERECGTVAGQAARECIAQIVKSERESQRGESDLAAQWKAADWALWAGIIAGPQLLATGVGLYLLKGTLDETRKAVEDTGKATEAMQESNNIMRKQMRRELLKTRPIVRVAPGARFQPAEEKWLSAMSDEDRARCCSFSCTIENSGKADCWLVDCWIKFEYVTSTSEGGEKSTQFTCFRLVANAPLSGGESFDVDGQLYLLPLDIKERVYAGQGYFRGYCVYRDNDTSTTFGATFGFRMDVIDDNVIARNRTNDLLDWQDGIVQSVELERYGHIHFMLG